MLGHAARPAEKCRPALRVRAARPPPAFPFPAHPPMAAFLDLYGGYANLTQLLAELNRYDVFLDPMRCHPFELYTYAAWAGVSALLALVGVVLYMRDSSRRVLFRMAVVVPAVLYTPILLGFTAACLSQQQTQEPGFATMLLVIVRARGWGRADSS